MAHTFPPQSDMDAILNAADNDVAQVAYEEAIDTLIDSRAKSRNALIDYAMNILGVGNKYTGTEAQRYPANLFAYVVLTGKKSMSFSSPITRSVTRAMS
ncbi:MAG: hypothetical protein R2877_07030 [Bdellovibrionota bacterium]